MTTRLRRHERIKGLICDHEIRNQYALRQLLAEEGIEVTQATLSRDLRELGVAKGSGRYVLPSALGNPGAAGGGPGPSVLHGLGRTLRQQLVGAVSGGAVVVLRTPPGHANALAIEIDRARLPEVAGTIAGDDTVFVAVASNRDARALLRRVESLIESTADPVGAGVLSLPERGEQS